MLRSAVSSLLFGLCVSTLSAEEPKQAMQPISEADSVLAVYRESSGGIVPLLEPAIILVAWSDGHLVWSLDRLKGGAPYRAGRVDPKKIAALLARFDKDGLFADENLNRANFGPDSQFITMLIKSGKKQVKMQSWHELFEDSDGFVADDKGASTLDGRRRLDVLRKASSDYLFFRFVWSETRAKLTDLIPGESTASAGKPFMEAGVLSWQEPAATPKPNGAGSPSRK
jgi:hypothetical protein